MTFIVKQGQVHSLEVWGSARCQAPSLISLWPLGTTSAVSVSVLVQTAGVEAFTGELKPAERPVGVEHLAALL